jgi:hypothetical protein
VQADAGLAAVIAAGGRIGTRTAMELATGYATGGWVSKATGGWRLVVVNVVEEC